MRVIVCGGRQGVPRAGVYAVLDALSPDWREAVEWAHGDALGVDRHSGSWAKRRGEPVTAFRIDSALDGWREDAPKNRNIRMLTEFDPDVVIGFPGGPGTRHMLKASHAAGKTVLDVEIEDRRFTVYRWRTGAAAKIAEGSF